MASGTRKSSPHTRVSLPSDARLRLYPIKLEIVMNEGEISHFRGLANPAGPDEVQCDHCFPGSTQSENTLPALCLLGLFDAGKRTSLRKIGI